MTTLVRYYSEPQKGTSGYSSTIGSGSASCFDSGYGISCTTTPPATINIPGKAASPGGVKSIKYEYIVDCKEQTYGFYLDRKLKKRFGKRWNSLEKATHPWVRNQAREYCNSVSELRISSFKEYAKKGIRKRNTRITGPDD